MSGEISTQGSLGFGSGDKINEIDKDKNIAACKKMFGVEFINRVNSIIVFNNFGGGIFQLIDGPSNHKDQLKYFTTPHHQSVKNTALDNGLNYYFCASQKDLAKTLKLFLDPMKKAAVLEIYFDREKNAKVFKQFKKIKLI